MKKLTFREPNVRARVTDEHGNANVVLAHASSLAELRARLEDRAFTVVSLDSYDFEEWRQRARIERAKAEAAASAGAPLEFKKALWAELKEFLFDLSQGCCAYCEARVLDVSSGDVEHFRPKARVDDDTTHRGYYWLAYDERNYLPACERCNRARGKRNHFPLAHGSSRARTPSDALDGEQPLLLNPTIDNTSAHLRYMAATGDLLTGRIEGRTQKGETSVHVYGLNRAELVESRRRTELDVRTAFFYALGQRDGAGAVRELLMQLRGGQREFSFARLAALEAAWREHRATIDDVFLTP